MEKNENMELVMIFTGMATICFGIAFGSTIAERCGHKVDVPPSDAAATAAGFIGLALVGLFFV